MNSQGPPAYKGPRYYGMTGPLSEELPTSHDLRLSEELTEELKKNKNFESPGETQKRVAVLGHMQNLVNQLVKLIGSRKGLSATQIKEVNGKVFTFGSYRLGVYGPGSDIDTLVVAPKHVSREDFFEHFPRLLHENSPAGAVEDLKSVPDAFVPIIKLEYSGISIDLIFARLSLSTIPNDIDLKNNDYLRGLSETDLRCLNGTRVTDEILTLVPERATFRLTLRAVKLWAQRRAIYANILGYPGGVAWAMLVARVCQMYPKASASKVLVKFFNLMSQWKWPTPILLCPIEAGPFEAKIWNPVHNRVDRQHLMPIITPAFPCMCATHNISFSTRDVIIAELSRGKSIADQIYDRQLPWDKLFVRHTFFTQDYKHYLSVVAASKTKDAHAVWSGLVESKVRRLVSSIDMSQDGIEQARPYVKGFERVHETEASDSDQADKVLQGSLEYIKKGTETTTTDLASNGINVAAAEGNADENDASKINADNAGAPTKLGKQELYTTNYYIGILLKNGSKSQDLSHSTTEFVRQCKEWPQFNEDLNSIRVIFVRNHDLPADVFEEGEERPSKVKKLKKPKTTTTEAPTKKRALGETTNDGNNIAISQKRVKQGDTG